MSNVLKQKLESLAKSETVHLDTLDIDVVIKKQTMADAKKVSRLGEDPVKVTHWVLSNAVFHENEPLVDPQDPEGMALVGSLTADIVTEITEAYAAINGTDLDELKKKL